jgi:hypothetical protein
MRRLCILLSSCLLVLLLSACGGGPVTPTAAPPTPTSYVGHAENESMLCAGSLRLTVTEVSHLSNAALLRVQVENTSGQDATWSPSAQAYVLDADQQLQVKESYGVMGEETVLAPGAVEQGEVVIPLPRGETFRFYYPSCEPAYVTLRKP